MNKLLLLLLFNKIFGFLNVTPTECYTFGLPKPEKKLKNRKNY